LKLRARPRGPSSPAIRIGESQKSGRIHDGGGRGNRPWLTDRPQGRKVREKRGERTASWDTSISLDHGIHRERRASPGRTRAFVITKARPAPPRTLRGRCRVLEFGFASTDVYRLARHRNRQGPGARLWKDFAPDDFPSRAQPADPRLVYGPPLLRQPPPTLSGPQQEKGTARTAVRPGAGTKAERRSRLYANKERQKARPRRRRKMKGQKKKKRSAAGRPPARRKERRTAPAAGKTAPGDAQG